MKLKKQVCTEQQAKRLKELGVVQDSQCYWRRGQVEHVDGVNSWADQQTLGEMIIEYDATCEPAWRDKSEIYSAFTVAELGEMLAYNAQIPAKSHDGDYWFVYLDKYEQFKTEAQTRAELLIYFLEKGGITTTEVNRHLQTA